MSKDITPGQLVMIIGSRHPDCPCIGMVGVAQFIIEAEQMYKGAKISGTAAGAWLVVGDGLSARNNRRFIDTGEVVSTWVNEGYTLANPRHLMPINPEADPLEVNTTKELEKV